MPEQRLARARASLQIGNLSPAVRSKIAIDAVASGCWLWTASRAQGYGQLKVGGVRLYAHRYVYEMLIGPIPTGLQIDHLCRIKHCVNPAHLEPVTQRVNLLRGDTIVARQATQTHCKRGHPFDAINTRMCSGHRKCRTCEKANSKRYYEKANTNSSIQPHAN